MESVISCLLDNWLALFWAMIGSAFVVIGIISAIERIRTEARRRRYRRMRLEREGARWTKNPYQGSGTD